MLRIVQLLNWNHGGPYIRNKYRSIQLDMYRDQRVKQKNRQFFSLYRTSYLDFVRLLKIVQVSVGSCVNRKDIEFHPRLKQS